MEIRRGDIYYADLTPVVGCEQGGRRPVLVIQNDVGNHHGSTVIVAAITSRRRRKRRLPTHKKMECDIKNHASYIANKIKTLGLDSHSFYFYIVPFNDAEVDKKQIMENLMM